MKLKGKIIQISCDGGAATGKSTGAKIIAKKLYAPSVINVVRKNKNIIKGIIWTIDLDFSVTLLFLNIV